MTKSPFGLLIIKPDFTNINIYMTFPIITACSYALSMTLAKKTSDKDSLFQQTFHIYISSFIGGTFGAILLFGFAPFLSKVALSFHSSEYFALMVLGLSAIAAFAGKGQVAKALMMAILGIMLATVGETALFNAPFQQLSAGAGILQQLPGIGGGSQVVAPLAQTNPYLQAAGAVGALGTGLGALIGN